MTKYIELIKQGDKIHEINETNWYENTWSSNQVKKKSLIKINIVSINSRTIQKDAYILIYLITYFDFSCIFNFNKVINLLSF